MFLQKHFAMKKGKYSFIPDRGRKSIIWLTNLLEEHLCSLSNICKLNRILNLFTGSCWMEHVSRAIQGRGTFDKHTCLQGKLCASPQSHDAGELSAMPHAFSSSFGLWIKSIWNQWGSLCRLQRTLDQALWRKCRSGSTDLIFISFCFSFPLLALISERNMLYSICSQTVLGHEPLEPGTVSLGCQKRKEHGCSAVFLAPLMAGSFHQIFFSFLIIRCSGRKYLAF